MRPAFDALFAIDDAMGDVVAQSTQPALGAIKLAWWRERLEELDEGKVPAEPRLQAAASDLLTRGISGVMLAGLEGGWATLLDQWPDAERVGAKGARLFAIGATLLSVSDHHLDIAGSLFATVDLARRTRDHGWLSAADEWQSRRRFAKRVRPLTALTALASRDLLRFKDHGFEPEGTPGRAWALLRHRLTGRV